MMYRRKPINVLQARPIQEFWALLSSKVYDNVEKSKMKYRVFQNIEEDSRSEYKIYIKIYVRNMLFCNNLLANIEIYIIL